MSLDPVLILVSALTFLLGGLSKGALGFGLPLIAIPMLTAFSSLPMALSIAIPPVVATNLWQVWSFRSHRRQPFLVGFLVPGAVGLLVGVYLLTHIEDAYLEIALGTLVLIYLGLYRQGGGGAMSQRTRMSVEPGIGVVAGLVHGTTGMSGLIGPPFFHAIGLQRPAFIFCTSLMFTLFSVMHVPALATVGLFQSSAIVIGSIALLPAFAGLWLGSRFGDRLKAATFSNLVQAVLAIAAILPIWNGLQHLLSVP